MTWLFLYITAAILGLVLWGVSTYLAHAPVPPPEARNAATRARRRRAVGAGSLVFGGIGLAASWWLGVPNGTACGAGLVAGIVVGAAVAALARPHRAAAVVGGTVVVVRGMPPGGFGQVRVGEGTHSALLAARNLDSVELLPGTRVEVVEGGTPSVVAVRRPGEQA